MKQSDQQIFVNPKAETLPGRFSFFDFDGTLTTGDSFTGFIRHVHGLAGLLRIGLLSAPAIILWKCGLRSNVFAKLRMYSLAFAGMSHDAFRAAGRTYIRGIDAMLRPEVVAKLDRAVADGETVAIVSASLGDWIRPWAAAHGVKHVIATEPEINANGKLTGRFATKNCERTEKTRRILETFPVLAENRADCCVTAYGDSHGDTELLAFADHPVKILH